MRIGNLTFEVSGMYYLTLIEHANEKISDFLDIPVEELTHHVSYEIDVVDDPKKDGYYIGKVNARIKNV